MSGRPWKVGDRVRLRRGAVGYRELGAGSFVIVELGETFVVGLRGKKLRRMLPKKDLVHMGRGL